MINRTLKPIAAAVALANAGFMTSAHAQTSDAAADAGEMATGPVLEEVVVTGMRYSLAASMDVKREKRDKVFVVNEHLVKLGRLRDRPQ